MRFRPRRSSCLLVAVLAAAGCDERAEPPSGDSGAPDPRCDGGDVTRLLAPEQWRAAATPDPLEAHRPSLVECSPIAGWYPEDDALEVDTGRCNYVDLTQPVDVSGTGRRRLRGSITHFDLVAPEPTAAHVAMLLDGMVLWERDIPIPSPANSFTLDVSLQASTCSDAELRLHLHNHGQNTWVVGPLTLFPD